MHDAVRRLLASGDQIAVTEVVVMELLAGARGPRHLRALRSDLLSFRLLPLGGLLGYEEAAAVYRSCRAGGETVRRMRDCLVAVPVIRAGASILHKDRDFDVIARHTELRIEPVLAA